MRQSVLGATLCIGTLVAASTAQAGPALTLEDRIAAQRAIEEVYWRHRMWPQENPNSKPSLESVMSEPALRAKVEEYLRKSAALERLWQRPITGEQLQAELDRMANRTQAPRTLKELFDALGGDADLIAETLVRQSLADRLVRNWYAGDDFDAWWAAERAKLPVDVEVCASTFELPDIGATECTNDTWTPTAMEVPDMRSSHTAIWTGTEMIVWGGKSELSGPHLYTGGRYNPATDTWIPTSIGANVPVGRTRHAAVWTGTEMIVWGGTDGFHSLQSGGRYDPATDTWLSTSTGTNVPGARYSHTAVWTGTEMIIWGGYFVLQPTDRTNTGGRYNPFTNSWLPTSTGANVPPGGGHLAVWTGTEMIVCGVEAVPGGRYSPATDVWTGMSTVGMPAPNAFRTGVWTGTELIVWGGDGSNGARYKPSTDAWTPTSTGPNVPQPRLEPTSVWTGTEMLVWGGYPFYTTGGRYNPSTDSWSMLTAAGAPYPRQSHTAIWTGSEMIVWGGDKCDGYCPPVSNTGGRYDPATNSWIPTATEVNVPGARSGHTSVWTGNEMIVWGGLSGDSSQQAMNSGGRYNPAIDVWTPTSRGAGVPSARESHTAVWTGTEMVVWGGHPGRDYPPYPTNDGARYDPVLDHWTPTSNGANVPRARVRHSAVWTGTEMIVWGGLDAGPSSDTFLNTGGRYDPAANQWTTTSTAAAVPTARMSHTAVWTGSQMIVWGGYTGGSSSSAQNSGARYAPATNSWTATSIGAGVPSPRARHSAVWSGSEMIVWGGRNVNAYVGNGSRYDPLTDGWSLVPAGPFAPDARQDHSAVWTGREMIVWGGQTNVPPEELNTGARYDPALGTWMPTSIGANVPPGRDNHTAAWTGSEMIVWGGTRAISTAGRYCACPSGRFVYRDVDGDGSGIPSQSISSCDGTAPPGYAATDTDCNDADAAIHPGAAELCDALDDDCDGLIDEGATVENSDADPLHDACDNCPSMTNAAQSDLDDDGEGDACDVNDGTIWQWRDAKVSLSWQEEAGPTSWNVYLGDLSVLRGTGVYTQIPGSNALAERLCGMTATTLAESSAPASGAASFSLVTGVTGGVEGSLGSSSSGSRANANPCP